MKQEKSNARYKKEMMDWFSSFKAWFTPWGIHGESRGRRASNPDSRFQGRFHIFDVTVATMGKSLLNVENQLKDVTENMGEAQRFQPQKTEPLATTRSSRASPEQPTKHQRIDVWCVYWWVTFGVTLMDEMFFVHADPRRLRKLLSLLLKW